MVKNLPTMQETWARSLDGKDPLEKEMANHFSIFVPGGFHGLRSLAIHGFPESQTQLSDQHFHRVSQVMLVVKSPPAKAGEARGEDLIPGSGRSPGEGNGNPLQYS